jgi:hypothetical protein
MNARAWGDILALRGEREVFGKELLLVNSFAERVCVVAAERLTSSSIQMMAESTIYKRSGLIFPELLYVADQKRRSQWSCVRSA